MAVGSNIQLYITVVFVWCRNARVDVTRLRYQMPCSVRPISTLWGISHVRLTNHIHAFCFVIYQTKVTRWHIMLLYSIAYCLIIMRPYRTSSEFLLALYPRDRSISARRRLHLPWSGEKDEECMSLAPVTLSNPEMIKIDIGDVTWPASAAVSRAVRINLFTARVRVLCRISSTRVLDWYRK